MNLTNKYIGVSGETYIFTYYEADDFSHLPYDKCTQCYAVCYVGDNVIIVKNGKKNTWGLIGGTIEKDINETYEQTLERELIEEGNVQMTYCKPLGYQEVLNPDGSIIYQLRYYAEATKIGEFVSDPAASVTEVAFINPEDVKKYFDWKEIGDRIFEQARDYKFKKS